ncbi:ABC transporter permease [Companilactobacillus huachuanensis]|uniref:ABC transporter permease n=1 Tax=Companilactobacillus huachuanensis TaxID=2559914 RepID=A0ABW1RIX8_9LACO|nr:ABC transporter permease [Companilactobacillus huachuanensis]
MIKDNSLKSLTKIKFKLLIKNFSAISGSLIAVLFSILFRYTLSDSMFNGQRGQFILMMTVLFNAVMSSIMMISIPMAEEKEKKSLKLLVSSAITPSEYLIATLTPSFIVIMGTNLVLPLLSDVRMEAYFYFQYIIITFMMTVISMIIGLLIGILCKKVSDTSYFVTPVILPLILIPQLGTLSEIFKNISDFIYTGVLLKMLMKVVINQSINFSVRSVFVIIIELIVLVNLFSYLYNKKGLKINEY